MAIRSNKSITGYVAFLDILGFSELVSRADFKEEFPRYSKIIDNAVQTKSSPLEYVTFSDSIVVTTESASLEHLKQIIGAVGAISYHLLCDLGVPIRGCISKGNFSRLVSGNDDIMIAGPAIIEAYQWEQYQNWIGSMLSPSVIRHDKGLVTRCALGRVQTPEEFSDFDDRQPWPFLLHMKETIPFHVEHPLDTRTYKGWVIVPKSREAHTEFEFGKDLNTYTEKLEELMAFAPTPEAQKKYQATMNWINYDLKKSWDSTFSHGWPVKQETAT